MSNVTYTDNKMCSSAFQSENIPCTCIIHAFFFFSLFASKAHGYRQWDVNEGKRVARWVQRLPGETWHFLQMIVINTTRNHGEQSTSESFVQRIVQRIQTWTGTVYTVGFRIKLVIPQQFSVSVSDTVPPSCLFPYFYFWLNSFDFVNISPQICWMKLASSKLNDAAVLYPYDPVQLSKESFG